jgi:hypothetical protein
MPWREPHTVPLTRIDIVSRIPSKSGVYAIKDGEVYLLVGEAWNLMARLLELMNVLQDVGEFSVTYELCGERDRRRRKDEISGKLLSVKSANSLAKSLPGISFGNSSVR